MQIVIKTCLNFNYLQQRQKENKKPNNFSVLSSSLNQLTLNVKCKVLVRKNTRRCRKYVYPNASRFAERVQQWVILVPYWLHHCQTTFCRILYSLYCVGLYLMERTRLVSNVHRHTLTKFVIYCTGKLELSLFVHISLQLSGNCEVWKWKIFVCFSLCD